MLERVLRARGCLFRYGKAGNIKHIAVVESPLFSFFLSQHHSLLSSNTQHMRESSDKIENQIFECFALDILLYLRVQSLVVVVLVCSPKILITCLNCTFYTPNPQKYLLSDTKEYHPSKHIQRPSKKLL